MVFLRNLISDLELEEEFLRNLKHREVEQKFIYLGENAAAYYDTPHLRKKTQSEYLKRDITIEERTQFILKRVVPGKKTALVSLGCGNAMKDVYFLKALKEVVDCTYFGIDSSKEMLTLAKGTLNTEKLRGNLLCADFSSIELRQELTTLLKSYDQVLFLFIDYTFNNLIQTEIVDTLFNLMSPGQLLFLDIPLRPSMKKSDDLTIFQTYTELLENKERMKFFLSPITEIGIPIENGSNILKASYEESLGVFKLRFSFRIEKATTIQYKGETIHFLPAEEIKWVNIRFYDYERFISYLANHNFTFIESEVVLNQGQFCFQR